MGTLDLLEEKQIRKIIASCLKRRGLILDDEEEWYVHGPHDDMDYQVFIGKVYFDLKFWPDEKKNNGIYVAVYPRAVYQIDDADDWYKVSSENKIELRKKIT